MIWVTRSSSQLAHVPVPCQYTISKGFKLHLVPSGCFSLSLSMLRNFALLHSQKLFIACLDPFVPVPALSFGLNCSPPTLVFTLVMHLWIAIRSHLSFHFARLENPGFSQFALTRGELYSPCSPHSPPPHLFLYLLVSLGTETPPDG